MPHVIRKSFYLKNALHSDLKVHKLLHGTIAIDHYSSLRLKNH